jgi:hypothetical protein
MDDSTLRISDSVDFELGSCSFCIVNKFPGDANAKGVDIPF